MNKTLMFIILTSMVCFFSSCATMKGNVPVDPDQITQAFFNDLQKSDYESAYSLFGKGLCQRMSYEQFDQFMQTTREQWGRIVTQDTATMPFHRRAGEVNFIPLHLTPKQIKRYIFDVKFDSAEMNYDLTLAPQEGVYKIVWFSIWGSSIYMTPKVQEKIEQLFSSPNDTLDNSSQ